MPRLPGRPAHLARRFMGSLRPGGPDPAAEAALLGRLSEAEADLYRSLAGPDRRHAVASAAAAVRLLGEAATDELIVASALHDVGKLDAQLGTLGRAVASIAAGLLGPDRLERLGERSPWTRRWWLYANHAALGAERLAAIGCAEPVVAWARDHHRSPSASSLGADVARALVAADDR